MELLTYRANDELFELDEVPPTSPSRNEASPSPLPRPVVAIPEVVTASKVSRPERWKSLGTRRFFIDQGVEGEELRELEDAWSKAVHLHVTLWARPYAREGFW